MVIKGEGFQLREWEGKDAPALAEIANSRKIFDNLRDAFPHPYTLADAEKFIAMAGRRDPGSLLLAIEVDGKVAGSMGVTFLSDVYRLNAEIGYYLGERFQGRGIMWKVLKTVASHVFSRYEVVRIFAEPFARNTASCRTLEKAGFSLEARLKGNVIKNGIIEDSCIYAIHKNRM